MNDWSDAESRVEKAQELFESGRLEDALGELRAALAVNPFHGEWHFNMGVTLDAMGRFEEAVDAYEQALEHHGETADILYNLGVDCLRLNRPEDSIAYFDRVEKLDPLDEHSYIYRIEAYALLGEHEQAELMFYMACQLDDEHPRSYFNISLSLLNREQYDRAIWCLNRARRLDPQDPDVHLTLAGAYRKTGGLDQSYRSYVRYLRLDPGDVLTLVAFGELLIEMERRAEAAEKFRRAVELDPLCASGHYWLGVLAMESHHLDAAQSGFELALQLDRELACAHQKLAAVALGRGQLKTARRHLRQELSRDGKIPSIASARELAGLLMDAGMCEEAVEILERLVSDSPMRGDLRHELAVALFRLGRIDAGIRQSRRAVRTRGDLTTTMRNLAEAHLRLGQMRRAAYWVKRALATEPEDPGLKQLRSKVRILIAKAKVKRMFGK